ncbi:MAG: N4-gp56 family major capsid protein [Gammaproteobacteria bacterium]|nr:N4-gp56 family major capsid protein [Gammaproteobacteria bacterium]
MPITTYGDISPRVGIHAVAKMLEHAQPQLVIGKFAQSTPMPANKGQTLKWRRAVPWAPALTPLAEGVRPNSQQLAFEDVTATLGQYGSWAELTDVIADTHEDPVLNTMMELSGEQAAETREILDWGVLRGGTSVFWANGTARNAVNTPVNITKIRAVVRFLMAQRGKKITKIQDGSIKVGTKPVEAAYVGLCHTDVVADLRAVPGFTPVAEYGSRQMLCEFEVGCIEDVRFVATPLLAPFANAGGSAGTMISTGGTAADVYPIIFLAQDAFGTVPFKGKDAVHPLVRNPGKPEKGDELGQTGSVGWKMWHVSKILNQTWMARLEVAVSKL